MDDIRIQQFNEQARRLGMLTIRIPPHYQRLVREEVETLGRTDGPLYRVVYPTAGRTDSKADHDVPDFVEDRTNMPSGLESLLIHKYHNRALFLVTDVCAGHCMYCFRQDVLTDLHARELQAPEKRLDAVIAYLKDHPQVTEVILSGGDPLSVPFRHLERIMSRLDTETAVRDIRIHTRNIVFSPKVMSERVCELIGRYRVRLYLHLIHPYEIAEPVVKGITRLKFYGVRLYSQFPILRGINDRCEVLERLIRMMDDLGITPVNLFVPDPINYSAPFRIPMKRLFSLMDNLYWRTSSWNNSAHLVLDTPIGKVRREDIADWDEGNGLIIFRREGKTVTYHDFPGESDIPGDLETLLWKG
ncbi:4Fe-4S cluster-binding domain-containing protein [Desulfococcaceae bacterium HSG8]|nr:4Fe-4S cluster-binding domain-containing protein [Desulfococcaceae bacterium HSG8]